MEQSKAVSINASKQMIALLVTYYSVNLIVLVCFGSTQMTERSNTGTPVSTLGEEMGPLAHKV